MGFLITREIGIDCGHRVTLHGSKCRNLHGHRYTIQATCEGQLHEEGEQSGMVLDFGFLKDEMMKAIDEPCDHGMLLWYQDPWLEAMSGYGYGGPSPIWDLIDDFDAGRQTEQLIPDAPFGKLLVLKDVPTAENLARHWFNKLSEPVQVRSGGLARLSKIKVWETPNCSAEYPA